MANNVNLAFPSAYYQQFIDKNGKPIAGGKLYTYIAGSSTAIATYKKIGSVDATNTNTNPIILDMKGMANIVISRDIAYKFVLCDKNDVKIDEWDNITAGGGEGYLPETIVVRVDGTEHRITSTASRDGENRLIFTIDIDQDFLDRIDGIEEDVESLEQNKKDIVRQDTYTANGSSVKTIKKLTQDPNGEVEVEFEDIDLPPENPNVEVTSDDSSIQVTESTDAETNTKTFDLSVNINDPLEYGQFRATNVSKRATLNKIKGNLNLNNNAIVLKKGNSYHFTLRGTYVPSSATNTYANLTYIEYSAFQSINVNVDNTITDSQCFEISYDVYNLSRDLDYIVEFAASTSGTVSELWVEVHNLNGVSINGTGGGTYTASDAIDITNNEISVKYGKGLTINASNQLEIKAGAGLAFNEDTLEVEIDSEVSDVVESVEKLKEDLDTQLTTNFDMPNVDNVYDFADPSVIGMSNGAVMLCQAFAVPINHDIRIDDGQTDNPTLLGIYAKQAFAGKKIMLALYVYDFSTGYTDYVGDTGPVEVAQGRNEFALKHINPNATELKSSCVYYASLYLPSNAHSNGLYLAGCPSYSNASYINATPRFSVGVENITYNNQEIDMTDATTGRLDYNDGNGNYYIGPWSDNYNERPSIPRFFIQFRNGEVDTPIVVEPFTDIGTYTLKNTDSVSSVFGSSVAVNTDTYGAMFMEVTPSQDVDVTGWICYDNYSTDERQWYGKVFDSAFENSLSTASDGTLTELGETSAGVYGHEFSRTSPLHLSANTTYRFLVGIPHSDNDLLIQYNTPTNEKSLHLFASGYNVSQWVTYSRANNVQGINFVIKDANSEWRI